MLVIANNVLLSGLTPFRVTQKPKYSILVWPKKEFSVLHLSPYYFIYIRLSSNFVKYSFQSKFVKSKSSSINARIKFNPWNSSFIFSWKMSDELLTPIGRRFYWYLPIEVWPHRGCFHPWWAVKGNIPYLQK